MGKGLVAVSAVFVFCPPSRLVGFHNFSGCKDIRAKAGLFEGQRPPKEHRGGSGQLAPSSLDRLEQAGFLVWHRAAIQRQRCKMVWAVPSESCHTNSDAEA